MNTNHPALKPTVHIDQLPLLKLLRPGARRRKLQAIGLTGLVLLLAGASVGLAHESGLADDVWGKCACEVNESDESC